jgi:hypothetical protein
VRNSSVRLGTLGVHRKRFAAREGGKGEPHKGCT